MFRDKFDITSSPLFKIYLSCVKNWKYIKRRQEVIVRFKNNNNIIQFRSWLPCLSTNKQAQLDI